MSPLSVARCAVAVAAHPRLWLTACRQYRAALPRQWWRRHPFVPIPPGDYVRFRLQTQYGSVNHRIDTVDVLNNLSWCKTNRALAS
jgi:hypothetical protein